MAASFLGFTAAQLLTQGGAAAATISAGTALTAASLAYGVYASIQAGQSAQAIADFNASVAEQNTELAKSKAEIERINTQTLENMTRERGRKVIGAKRVSESKSGVETTTGASLLSIEDIAKDIELDATRIRFAGSQTQANIASQEASFRQDALKERLLGRNAVTRSRGKAGQTLLTGLEKFVNAA